MSLTTFSKEIRTRAVVTMIETYPIAVIRDRSVELVLVKSLLYGRVFNIRVKDHE